ncbi:MAG: tRNA (N(6)-L-threonylcarbamoyladenosine(37)-C(2))-methylthiotransferase MtaB [Myxococcota bacterium]
MKNGRLKVSVVTFGCRTNQYDSALIADNISAFAEVSPSLSEDADAVVVNTCAVTHKPERNLRKLLNHIDREMRGKPVIVAGCYAHLSKEDIAELPGVVAVLTNDEREEVAERVAYALGVEFDNHSQSNNLLTRSFGLTRPNVKVQDGCDYFCSFCAVPFARGRPRSRPDWEIVAEVGNLASSGVKEVVITGINIGSYGRDMEGGGLNLARLIRKISRETDIERLRISSIEPMEVTESLISEMAENPKVCAHIHLPLQSGSERVLKDMRRPYSAADFRSLVEELRGKIPNLCIGMDVIVGFPTEDGARFEESYEFVRSLDFSYLHIFSYSRRRGTSAWAIKAASRPEEVRERVGRLKELSKARKRAFAEKQVGGLQRVVIEYGRGEKTKRSYGLTDNYLTVYFEGYIEPQSVVRAKLVELYSDGFYGKAMDE